MDKENEKLRRELRKAKRKIRNLEKSMGDSRPTFYEMKKAKNVTTTLNGHRPNSIRWNDQ